MVRLISVLVVAFALAAPASASEHNRAREAVRSGQILPLSAIAQRVRGEFGGKIIDVR